METRHGGIKKRKWCDVDFSSSSFPTGGRLGDEEIETPGYKFFRWEEDDFECNEIQQGGEERKKEIRLPSLRTPIRNCIPNYFVPRKILDQRGKKKSNRLVVNQQQQDGTHHDLICDCCHNHDPSRFTQDSQNCPVCEDCGVVQTSQITYSNELQESQKKNSQGYKRRSYLGERLRQFSDSEPRIPEPDLQTIRYTYARLREAFDQGHPLFKKSPHKREKYIERLVESFTTREEDTTKQHIKALLDFIDHSMDTPGILKKSEEKRSSFKKKYLERWAQIKKYFCGDSYYFNNLVTKPNERILDLMFKLATLVTMVYENKSQRDYILSTPRYHYVREEEDEEFFEEVSGEFTSSSSSSDGCCCGLFSQQPREQQNLDRFLDDPVNINKKRNMPSIDLLFLMILFADGEDSLEVHGWYFVKKIMHEYTFKLPTLSSSPPGKSVRGILEERKKKRDSKFNALRVDFLILKKILTHLNQDFKTTLDNIPEFVEESIKTPKNIGQLVKIAARNKDLYQYT